MDKKTFIENIVELLATSAREEGFQVRTAKNAFRVEGIVTMTRFYSVKDNKEKFYSNRIAKRLFTMIVELGEEEAGRVIDGQLKITTLTRNVIRMLNRMWSDETFGELVEIRFSTPMITNTETGCPGFYAVRLSKDKDILCLEVETSSRCVIVHPLSKQVVDPQLEIETAEEFLDILVVSLREAKEMFKQLTAVLSSPLDYEHKEIQELVTKFLAENI